MLVKVFCYQMLLGLVRTIIFGTNMSSFVHINNKKKDILILTKDPTNGSDDITLTSEKECSINFTEQQKKMFKFTLQ